MNIEINLNALSEDALQSLREILEMETNIVCCEDNDIALERLIEYIDEQ